MESIKVYFRNALIGFATMILTSVQTPTNQSNLTKTVDNLDDDSDVHMFI